jgi:hypothetical protein
MLSGSPPFGNIGFDFSNKLRLQWNPFSSSIPSGHSSLRR